MGQQCHRASRRASSLGGNFAPPLPILWRPCRRWLRCLRQGSSMREAWKLWRGRPAVRGFFVAHAQGALGDAAGYVALLLLAYERMGSAWAATALTLADFGPAMLLGPLFGALVDRRGALRCAIASDLLRAGAFAGLALVDSTAGLVALALTAGVGSALFRPATGALIPALTTDEQLSAANALHGMVRDGGQLLGPALAAGLLLAVAPEAVLGLNAATFVVSAFLLMRLRARIRPVSAGGKDAREAETGGFRTVLADAR